MPQTYATHVHRPIATAVGYFFVVIALSGCVRWYLTGSARNLAIGLFAMIFALGTVLLISRTYITRLQDRIIKLEMRVRTAPVLTTEQQRLFAGLTNKQIAALRFASDGELPELVDRAARESLKPDEIKRAVKHWLPDLDRT